MDTVPQDVTVDFLIVGGGSAGCVLASRLSADGYQVLLLEAGGRASNINLRIPLLVANVLDDRRYIWPYMTEPQEELHGRRHLWTRGKVIGGSGSINGNLFVRGDPQEYDSWRNQLGCVGWGYSDLLPVFMRIEDFPEGDPKVRGRGGPIHCTRLDGFDALSDAFLAACAEFGIPTVRDYNDGTYEGAGYLQYSTRRGLRNSSAVGYLNPALRRRNLWVLLKAAVTRVIMDGSRATGVEFQAGDKKHRAFARREVILAAGPLASPHILELSGIGNGEILQRAGINVVHHLPGVGENLRDHPNCRLTFECAQPITINDVLRSPWLKAKEALKFAFKRQGLLSICVSTAQAVVRSADAASRPNLVLRLAALSGKDRYARTPKLGLDPFPGFTLGVTLLYPRSVGAVHIQSTDPLRQPAMDPKYLSDAADRQLFVDGIRLVRRLSRCGAFAQLIVRETRPGANVTGDSDLMDYIRATVSTSWHQIGTCKMGVDDHAVVDPALRVRGIGNLRVIDSSICPTLPSSNTNIPTVAIAEKGADLVLSSS